MNRKSKHPSPFVLLGQLFANGASGVLMEASIPTEKKSKPQIDSLYHGVNIWAYLQMQKDEDN